MNKQSRHVSGVSLIELIIVIGIIGILSAIVLANLIAARNQRDVQAGSQQLASHLREVQNYALTGKATGIDDNNCSYGLRPHPTNANQYQAIRKSGSSCGTETEFGTYDLPRGVTRNDFTPILFALPRATPSAEGWVCLTKGTANAWVYVSMSGQIEERTTSCP